MEKAFLKIERITKAFSDVEALRGISFDVMQGEFITLLGASGCGKTTLLRIIAGLESADSGRIILDGADVTNAEPNRRPVNTVFQNYALFPHMNVSDNIGYSLKIRRIKKNIIKEEVEKALSLVRLQGYGNRMPDELSGGQRQRVAIARAVVNTPKVLLLDEPLGALDLALRREMQGELKRLQTSLGITFVYITHDQEEALNMSDRIAVMREGRLLQLGTPNEIYDAPDTAYVARFVGESNIITGIVKNIKGDIIKADAAGAQVSAMKGTVKLSPGDTVRIAVRRENILFDTKDGIEVSVSDKLFSGGQTRITFLPTAGGAPITAVVHGIDPLVGIGDTTRVSWSSRSALAVRGDEE